MRYMGMFLFPVLVGFACYNLVFQGTLRVCAFEVPATHAADAHLMRLFAEFASWYEYVLTTAVSAVYTFG
jgi:hypothetical protein